MKYSEIKPMKFYKNKPNLLLWNREMPPTMLVELATSKESVFETLRDPYYRLRMSKFQNVVSDVLFREKIGAKMIKLNNRAEFIKLYKEELIKKGTFIKFIPASSAERITATKKNFIYDLSTWMTLFFSNRRIKDKAYMSTTFLDFLYSKISSIENTNEYKKIIHVDIEYWSNQNKAGFGISRKNLNDPISILLTAMAMKNDETLSKFKDIDFLITERSSKSFFVLPGELLEKKNFAKVKVLLKKFISFSWNTEKIDEIPELLIEEDKLEEAESEVKSELTKKVNTEKAKIIAKKPNSLHKDSTHNDITAIVANSMKRNLTGNSEETKIKKEVLDNIIDEINLKDSDIIPEFDENDEYEDYDTDDEDISEYMDDVPSDNNPALDIDDINQEELIEDAMGEDDEVELTEDEAIEKEAQELDELVGDDEDEQSPPMDHGASEVQELRYREMKELEERDEKARLKKEKLIKSLKAQQDKVIKINDRPTKNQIHKTSIGDAINTTNESLLESSFINFDSDYVKNLLESDIDSALIMLNNADNKVFVIKKEVVDSSTSMDAKRTLVYTLKDENEKQFTIKLDVPVLIDDKYIYLGGNRKIIQRQLFLNPISKIKADEVQIVTWYNKAFISRQGTQLNQKTSAVKKILNKNADKYKVMTGRSDMINNKEISVPLDYNNISKGIYSLRSKNGSKIIKLNLKDLNSDFKKLGIKKTGIPKGNIIIGYDNRTKTPISYNPNETSITDYIIDNIFDEKDKSIVASTKVGKKFAYTRVKIMGNYIPVILFLFYCEGFHKIMERASIKYRFTEDKKEVKNINQTTTGVIALRDGYILWDKYPLRNSMLMNGTSYFDMRDIPYAEIDKKEHYINLVGELFPSANIWSALDQFKDFMIDPKTEEVLRSLNQPTELSDVLIYATGLLCDNTYSNELDLSNYRIRSGEVVAQSVYKVITSSYKKYRDNLHKSKGEKMNVKQDAVIKFIFKQIPTLEEASSLNPILDMEKGRAITRKGLTGTNNSESYTVDKRAYDKSMIGTIGITTTNDAGVGILRQMTLEPKVDNLLGTVSKDINTDDLTMANLFTPAELLSPPGVLHDDPARTCMAYKQTKQMMPTNSASPVLIGNKVESIVPYHVSTDFVFYGKKDGKIIDKKEGLVIVEYTDGTRDAVDISKKMLKNSANGFWLESQMICDHDIGYKFKKNEIIAWDPRSFTKNSDDLGASLNIGTLCKVAVLANYDEFEDSAPITTKLAKRMATEIVMEESVFVGKNAFVNHIVKVGDKVKSEDVLISFDESFDDPSVNKLLETIGGNSTGIDKELVEEYYKRIKSHYTGEVVDIKIQSTVDVSELSESLAKIVQAEYNKVNRKTKLLTKYQNKDDLNYYKCGQIINKTTDPVDTKYGKLEGIEVGEGGVMIKFYIKYRNIAKKGDKVTNYTALKGVISTVIEEGYEAFTLNEPDEEISTMIAPGAILARKTPSILLAMFSNKCVIKMTEKARKMYLNSKDPIPKKRKALMTFLCDALNKIDPSGDNAKIYTKKFGKMTDSAFDQYMKKFLSNEDKYFYVEMIEYKRDLKMANIEAMAKFLGIELYEKVALPYVTMDKSNVVITPEPVPVGYIHEKLMVQLLIKKNSASINISKRNARTGQVTGDDKTSRTSDVESYSLIAIEANEGLKELLGPRADDMMAKNQMYNSIQQKGYCRLDELQSNPEDKVAINTLDAYYMLQGFKTNLVTGIGELKTYNTNPFDNK